MEYDVVIIGGGPAALTAAVYASRSNLSVLFIEKGAPGGKMVKTFKIENWTGDREVSGPELSMRMFKHSQAFGAKYKYGEVVDIKTISDKEHHVLLASKESIKAKAVIIATGMVERIPEEIKGILEFENRGVSYCAICDGPIFKDKPVAFIGGGNAAIEEAIFATQFASHVYVFVRNKIKADEKSVSDLKEKNNVTILLNSNIKEILGKNEVEKIIVSINGEEKEMPISAVFPYVGQLPVTDFLKHLNILDANGFIITDEYMQTKIKGVYAIGDVRKKEIRQIATAVADGAIVGKILANRL